MQLKGGSIFEIDPLFFTKKNRKKESAQNKNSSKNGAVFFHQSIIKLLRASRIYLLHDHSEYHQVVVLFLEQ